MHHIKEFFSIAGSAVTRLVTATGLATLASCGGDDNGQTASPPNFTSASQIQVVENEGGTFYTVQASSNGGAISYSVSGGEDAAALTLVGGQLKFVTPPDYDHPTDKNGDNIYAVRLSASAGQASATLDLNVIVTNDKEGVAVHRVATGFTNPVAIAAIPGDTRLFVAERAGAIYLLEPATGQKTLFQTISTATSGEGGLQAFAVSPSYASNGQYAAVWTGSSGAVTLALCRRVGFFGGPSCDLGVWTIPHNAPNNYGAFVGFGSNGKLYFALADAGGNLDPTGSAQSESSSLGKLLRVDDDPDPYAGASISFYILTPIAKGLRNPRGGTFYNGQLLLADRGEGTKEEINLLSLTGGQNFGWPAKEGTSLLAGSAPTGSVDPVIEYAHKSGGGIVGGKVYVGEVPSLQNLYVFADQSGAIYTAPVSNITSGKTLVETDLSKRTADFQPDSGALSAPVAFGEDNAGRLYIVDAGGDIFRVDRE